MNIFDNAADGKRRDPGSAALLVLAVVLVASAASVGLLAAELLR